MIVFLMETMIGTQALNSVKLKRGFANMFVINPLGRKCGMTILWNTENGVEVMNYSVHHTHLRIHESNPNILWFLSDFYDHPETNKRKESWSLLSRVHQEPNALWCVIGNFNEIRF